MYCFQNWYSNFSELTNSFIFLFSKLIVTVRPAPDIPPPYIMETGSTVLTSNHCLSLDLSSMPSEPDMSDYIGADSLSDSIDSSKLESYEDQET